MNKEIAYGTGMWAWLLQRITGFLLLIFLLLHVAWAHDIFSSLSPVYDVLFNDTSNFNISLLILLIISVPHALNGFRVFAIDFGISENAQKILFWILLIFGIILIIYVYYSRFG